ncbi:MAG TPA: crotonase/enoyl-CoA hydratase family protein [Sphingomonas sp.]
MYETILYDVADGVLTLTLNRPERLNAFTPRMREELVDAVDRADADDAVRAVVVTGAGRAFCAGADLSAGSAAFDYAALGVDGPVRADGSVDYAHEAVRDSGGLLTLRLFRCLKPLIAAINGPAVGIGATMTLPMDVRLIAEEAKVGFVFAKRGIVPEAASSWFLPRVVGVSTALEWSMTGRLVTAGQAKEAGLVRSVHAADELLPAAYALAREIADNAAPVSVALTRQMMWRGLGMGDPMEAHRVDSRAVYARGRSGDAREGVASFLEKRPAAYPDRVSRDMPDFFPWWEEEGYR